MRRMLALIVGVLLLVGCRAGRPALPKTYPVKGKVVDANGAPLKGGFVQFETDKPTDMTVVATIESDGAFSAKTFRDKEEMPGAPEGEYRLVVNRQIADGNAPPPAFTMPKPYKVEAKDNNFELKIGK